MPSAQRQAYDHDQTHAKRQVQLENTCRDLAVQAVSSSSLCQAPHGHKPSESPNHAYLHYRLYQSRRPQPGTTTYVMLCHAPSSKLATLLVVSRFHLMAWLRIMQQSQAYHANDVVLPVGAALQPAWRHDDRFGTFGVAVHGKTPESIRDLTRLEQWNATLKDLQAKAKALRKSTTVWYRATLREAKGQLTQTKDLARLNQIRATLAQRVKEHDAKASATLQGLTAQYVACEIKIYAIHELLRKTQAEAKYFVQQALSAATRVEPGDTSGSSFSSDESDSPSAHARRTRIVTSHLEGGACHPCQTMGSPPDRGMRPDVWETRAFPSLMKTLDDAAQHVALSEGRPRVMQYRDAIPSTPTRTAPVPTMSLWTFITSWIPRDIRHPLRGQTAHVLPLPKSKPSRSRKGMPRVLTSPVVPAMLRTHMSRLLSGASRRRVAAATTESQPEPDASSSDYTSSDYTSSDEEEPSRKRPRDESVTSRRVKRKM